jgi:hypothetical protein
MRYIYFFFLCIAAPLYSQAQTGSIPFMQAVEGVERVRMISQNWNCEAMLKDGKAVDFASLIGEIELVFTARQYTMSMGGESRSFDYIIDDGKIHFTNVKNYPDFQIVEMTERYLVADQYYPAENFTIRWTFSPK